MRGVSLLGWLGVGLALGGCAEPEAPASTGTTFTEADVRAFLDDSFDAILERDPVRICATFSHAGLFESNYQPYGADSQPIHWKYSGAEACENAKVAVTFPEQDFERRYQRIVMAADGRSAKVFGEYRLIRPNYDFERPFESLDAYEDLAVIEGHAESTVAMEDRKLVFVRELADSRVVGLKPRATPRSAGS